MTATGDDNAKDASHPSRVRGLKFTHEQLGQVHDLVAPFTGAWIEIQTATIYRAGLMVAPFTGAWIEMSSTEAL